MFLKSSHQVWPLSLNLGEMRGAVRFGALLHFKFLSIFAQKAIDPINRAEHPTNTWHMPQPSTIPTSSQRSTEYRPGNIYQMN